MLRVVRGPSEDLEKLLRRFKRICNREGILRDLKQHAFFEKPCDRRRRKQRERIRNIRRAKRRALGR